jgi:tetratricopeptide (TPR) repeat protein
MDSSSTPKTTTNNATTTSKKRGSLVSRMVNMFNKGTTNDNNNKSSSQFFANNVVTIPASTKTDNNLQTPIANDGGKTTKSAVNDPSKFNKSPSQLVSVEIRHVTGDVAVSGVSLKFLKSLIETSTFPKQDPTTNILCQNQHLLSIFHPPPENVRYCDVCKEPQETNSLLYSCQPCDYDMCEKCMNERITTPTMTHFVQHVIKPNTKATNESYLEHLAREQPSTIKPTADYFVSYVWAYPLRELIAALEYTLLTKQNKEDVFIWLDALCVNQHQVGKSTSTPEQLQITFGESLKAIGNVVMVLSNWKNPQYPKRIWCVFEAYMTKKIPNTKVILAMSEEEENSLVDAMIGNEIGQKFLDTYFGSVDVESAKAREPADEQAILQLIREYDVADVNGVVLGNLKQWLVQGGDVALKSVGESTKEAGNICVARGAVFRVLGEGNSALEWAEKALNICIRVDGHEHKEVAIGYINVAACLKDLGRLDEALVANDQAFTIFNKILGAEDPNIMSCLSWKATILQDQGKFDEALVIFDQVLQRRRSVLGEDHPDTIAAMAYKANCLQDLKKYEEALVLYEQVMTIDMKILGANHPDIAADVSNKAECLQEMGRAEEALPLYDQAIAIRKKVYGEVHPKVATIIGSKGLCLKKCGRFNDALLLYDQALAIDIKVYGQDHREIATDLNNKAFCLQALGRIDEAKELGKQSLVIAERVLGSSHPTTIGYREDWGS